MQWRLGRVLFQRREEPAFARVDLESEPMLAVIVVVSIGEMRSAVGSLSPQILGLRVPVYDPMVHYQQVRDAWGGVRAPDGR